MRSRSEHKLEKERDFREFIHSKFEDFYDSFEVFHRQLAEELLYEKDKHIFREAEEHRAIVESLVGKTLKLKNKLSPQKEQRPSFIQLLKPGEGKSSSRRVSVNFKSKKAKSPSFRTSSQLSSDNEEVDTSVDSVSESHKINFSRFIDKKEAVDLRNHEASFRRKTKHIIGNAIDRENLGKNKVEEILPQIGNFMTKAATKLESLSRMSIVGKTPRPFADLTSKMARETSQTTDRTARKTILMSTPT